MPIKEFYLDKVLEGFEMSQEEFIDLCILLGCDYVDKIKVGKYGNLDTCICIPISLKPDHVNRCRTMHSLKFRNI